MNIALVGFDTEGRSSYDFFTAQGGHQLTVCDQNSQTTVPADAQSVLGDNYLDNLDRFDLIVRTAGLSPQKILAKNPDVAAKITTHINEFFKATPTHNIIGVTGTKGKGTTSTLITRMLQTAGYDTHLGGNIGVPPLSFLSQLTAESWVVLELSSFQLSDLPVSPHIAVCLMVVPEHLNWHPDMENYAAAKANLFAHQTANDIAIYFADSETSESIAAHGHGHKLPYYQVPGALVLDGAISLHGVEICKTSEVKLLGEHNWQNACAAVTAVCQITHDTDVMRHVLTTFSGLPHRLEFVREVNGVTYMDDGFGTTPETAIVAMQALPNPKVLILGGSDKGADYHELAQAVLDTNVRRVVLIGEQAAAIQTQLDAVGFKAYAPGGDTMEAIVRTCYDQALPGDVVLLSPACASFDMFRDYKDRSAQFIAAVQALA